MLPRRPEVEPLPGQRIGLEPLSTSDTVAVKIVRFRFKRIPVTRSNDAETDGRLRHPCEFLTRVERGAARRSSLVTRARAVLGITIHRRGRASRKRVTVQKNEQTNVQKNEM